MAADDIKTEFHLTPKGWVTGTSRFFGQVDADGEIPRPQNAVETWERHVYQRSMWSPEEVTTTMLWHDTSVSTADRNALRDKFGPCGGKSERS